MYGSVNQGNGQRELTDLTKMHSIMHLILKEFHEIFHVVKYTMATK